MLNINKSVAHANNRWKKWEKIIYLADTGCQAQATSLLNCIRRIKSAYGYQNAELKRFACLRPYLTDVMFSNARSASLPETQDPRLYVITRGS